MSLISVIVPVYKAEKYLHRCVDSILGQTFTNFELILVDDGSPDNCGEICEKYALQDARVHVIHQENKGVAAARNVGLDWIYANSTSQWISFIDSDDWVNEKYLENLLKIAVESNVSLAMCDFQRVQAEDIDESKVARGRESYILDAEVAYIEKYNMVMPPWGKLYKKECFSFVRFPDGKLYEDAFVTHLLLFQAGKIVICENTLYYYYSNVEGITGSKWSPRCLDEIEAHDRRLFFLEELGCKAAVEKEILILCVVLKDQYNKIKKLEKCEVMYKKIIERKMRFLLKKYKKSANLKLSNYYWAYEVAYPLEMKIYWYFQAIKNRLKINN